MTATEHVSAVHRDALQLVAAGVPVLPLRESDGGKGPFGNCSDCEKNRCGGRPNMKVAGPCQCPRPCHAWAAATADLGVVTSAAWLSAWRQAAGVAYHPGGANLTVVDLDDAGAVEWARRELPATRVVPTTRGEHWIYLGAMQSSNRVRAGVDIKSRMAYARWRGPGDGVMTPLPDAVRQLVHHGQNEEATPPASLPVQRRPWSRQVASGCRHTERYVRTGLERGLAMVRERTESGAGSQAFGVARFLGSLHAQCPGPCDLEALGWEVVVAAVSVGVPQRYAVRSVANGFAEAGVTISMATGM
jgi:hypothetical protein